MRIVIIGDRLSMILKPHFHNYLYGKCQGTTIPLLADGSSYLTRHPIYRISNKPKKTIVPHLKGSQYSLQYDGFVLYESNLHQSFRLVTYFFLGMMGLTMAKYCIDEWLDSQHPKQISQQSTESIDHYKNAYEDLKIMIQNKINQQQQQSTIQQRSQFGGNSQVQKIQNQAQNINSSTQKANNSKIESAKSVTVSKSSQMDSSSKLNRIESDQNIVLVDVPSLLQPSSTQNDLIILSLLFISFLVHQYRLTNTLSRAVLSRNGDKVKLYRYGPLSRGERMSQYSLETFRGSEWMSRWKGWVLLLADENNNKTQTAQSNPQKNQSNRQTKVKKHETEFDGNSKSNVDTNISEDVYDGAKIQSNNSKTERLNEFEKDRTTKKDEQYLNKIYFSRRYVTVTPQVWQRLTGGRKVIIKNQL